jgi:hypothetical protein
VCVHDWAIHSTCGNRESLRSRSNREDHSSGFSATTTEHGALDYRSLRILALGFGVGLLPRRQVPAEELHRRFGDVSDVKQA